MSLLSPETLHIFVGPTNLVAVSRSRWRGRHGKKRTYPIAPNSGERWKDALEALATAFREFKCGRTRVVLSHHFVQFRLLAGRLDLANEMEFHALARMEFSTTFGALAQEWSIALSDEPPGLPRVASAIPKGLLDGLVAAAGEAKVRLLSVKPYLAVTADTWKLSPEGTTCNWLFLHEPGRVCVVARSGETWRWVRHSRVGEDWHQNISDILKAEAHFSGLEVHPNNVFVFAPLASSQSRDSIRKSGFRLLDQRSELGLLVDRDGAFAAANFG